MKRYKPAKHWPLTAALLLLFSLVWLLFGKMALAQDYQPNSGRNNAPFNGTLFAPASPNGIDWLNGMLAIKPLFLNADGSVNPKYLASTLSGYMPLTGGTFTGSVNFNANVSLANATQATTPAAGDNSDTVANTRYVALIMSTVAPTIKADLSLIGFLNGSVTLNVCASGCLYSTLHDGFYAALNLAHMTHDSTSSIIVQVADGTYSEPWQLVSQDPEGRRIQVLGNTSDRTKVVINFTNIVGNNLGGFVANYGGIIGYIDGFSLYGVGAISSQTATAIHWSANSKGPGISALNNGVVSVGPHMFVSGFYYGLVADHGGAMTADNAVVQRAGDVGVFAKFGGVMRCQSCSSSYTGDSDNALGSNYMAEQGGHLDIDSASGDQALYSGVASITGGTVWGNNYKGGSSGAGGLGGRGAWGIWAALGGSAQMENVNIQNYYDGAHTQLGGTLDVNGSTFENNNNNGLTADGGAIRGVYVTIQDNAGFGIQATHMGLMELYQTADKMSGNTAGNISQNTAGTSNGAAYNTASIYLD